MKEPEGIVVNERKKASPRPVRTAESSCAVICILVSFYANCCLAGGEDEPPPLRCGSQCLYTALKVFKTGPASFDELEKQMGQPTHQGYNLAEIQEAAEKCGLKTQAVSTTLTNLAARKERFCCIAHINDNHFVLVGDCDGGQVKLVDPPRSFNLPVVTFLSQWNGTALLLSDQDLESEESLSSRLRWIAILWRLGGFCVAAVVLFGGYRLWRARRAA